MPFTSSGGVWIFCIVTIHPPRVPSTSKALSFPSHSSPLREVHSATPGHQGTIKNHGCFWCLELLQEDKFRQAVGGDDDFRYLLVRNSFDVNWRFPDLAAKGTILILSQWTAKERIDLLWAHKPTIIWKTTQDTKVWYTETEIELRINKKYSLWPLNIWRRISYYVLIKLYTGFYIILALYSTFPQFNWKLGFYFTILVKVL